MILKITSFGFQRSGIPVDADKVIDARVIKNPHLDRRLRFRTGLDAEVRADVFSNPDIPESLLIEAQEAVRQGLRQGRPTCHVAFGCTGGRHRSVALAEEFAHRASQLQGVDRTLLDHIDLRRMFASHTEIARLRKQVRKLDKLNRKLLQNLKALAAKKEKE